MSLKIITDYKNHEKITRPLALALGFFDGFHIGHMALLEAAKATGLDVGVVTFSNSPASFIRKSKECSILMSNEDKISLLENYGMEYLIMPEFDDEIMNMSKEDFIEYFAVNFNAEYVISGFNFTFGKNREGSTENLASLTEPYNIKAQIISAVKLNDEVISSTLIREALLCGDIKKANDMLGRVYSVKGKVVNGRKIGRTLGFPTANISVSSEMLIPMWGVYFTVTEIDGKMYKSLTNIGDNPTVEGKHTSIETYIFDFTEDIYDKEIRIYFNEFIREQKKFENKQELAEQIKRDKNYVTQRNFEI